MDAKENPEEGKATPSLVWDIAVNPDHIRYSNGNHTSQQDSIQQNFHNLH